MKCRGGFGRTAALLALAFSEYARAEIDCDQGFLITTEEDAEKLGNTCKKLLGNLSISGYVQSTSLNITGLEFIGGSVKFVGDACTNDAPCEAGDDGMLSVTFTDLDTIEGDLDLSEGGDNMGTVSFPRMKVVNGTINSGTGATVDLRELEFFGALRYFPYDGGKVRLGSLRGFATPAIQSGPVVVYGEDIGYVSTSSVEDADTLFNRDMRIVSDYQLPSIYLALAGRDDQEDDYNVTIGWSRVDTVESSSNQFSANYHIEFGQSSEDGEAADSIEVNKLIYSGGKGWITKNPDLKSLTVHNFELNEVEILDRDETIINTPRVRKLPFDELGMLRVKGFRSQLLELPESALGWSNFSLVLERDSLHKAFNLTAYDDLDGGRQVWYWPETMREFSVEGSSNMWTAADAMWQDSFLETFNENNTKVIESFKIIDASGSVGCDELLKERGERLPNLAECIAAESMGYRIPLSRSLSLGIAAAAVLAVML